MQISAATVAISASLNDNKTDISLISSDKQLLHAHKLILSKVEYFNTMLYGSFALYDNVAEFNVPYKILRLVVDFIYTGAMLCIDIDELLECFKFANEICYTELEILLIRRINCDTTPVDKVISKLLVCKHHNEKLIMSKIKELCTLADTHTTSTFIQNTLGQVKFTITSEYSGIGYSSTKLDVFKAVAGMSADTIYICPVGVKWENCTVYCADDTYESTGKTKLVVFKPFLLRYLLIKYPHITQLNLDSMFGRYPTGSSKTVYIMVFKPFAKFGVDDPELSKTHLLALHHDEPNESLRTSRILIKLHLEKAKKI